MTTFAPGATGPDVRRDPPVLSILSLSCEIPISQHCSQDSNCARLREGIPARVGLRGL